MGGNKEIEGANDLTSPLTLLHLAKNIRDPESTMCDWRLPPGEVSTQNSAVILLRTLPNMFTVTCEELVEIAAEKWLCTADDARSCHSNKYSTKQPCMLCCVDEDEAVESHAFSFFVSRRGGRLTSVVGNSRHRAVVGSSAAGLCC